MNDNKAMLSDDETNGIPWKQWRRSQRELIVNRLKNRDDPSRDLDEEEDLLLSWPKPKNNRFVNLVNNDLAKRLSTVGRRRDGNDDKSEANMGSTGVQQGNRLSQGDMSNGSDQLDREKRVETMQSAEKAVERFFQEHQQKMKSFNEGGMDTFHAKNSKFSGPPSLSEIVPIEQGLTGDDHLHIILNFSHKDLPKFLYEVFSFLHRQTDLYVLHDEDEMKKGASKKGLEEGEAEKLVLETFRKFPMIGTPKKKGQLTKAKVDNDAHSDQYQKENSDSEDVNKSSWPKRGHMKKMLSTNFAKTTSLIEDDQQEIESKIPAVPNDASVISEPDRPKRSKMKKRLSVNFTKTSSLIEDDHQDTESKMSVGPNDASVISEPGKSMRSKMKKRLSMNFTKTGSMIEDDQQDAESKVSVGSNEAIVTSNPNQSETGKVERKLSASKSKSSHVPDDTSNPPESDQRKPSKMKKRLSMNFSTSKSKSSHAPDDTSNPPESDQRKPGKMKKRLSMSYSTSKSKSSSHTDSTPQEGPSSSVLVKKKSSTASNSPKYNQTNNGQQPQISSNGRTSKSETDDNRSIMSGGSTQPKQRKEWAPGQSVRKRDDSTVLGNNSTNLGRPLANTFDRGSSLQKNIELMSSQRRLMSCKNNQSTRNGPVSARTTDFRNPRSYDRKVSSDKNDQTRVHRSASSGTSSQRNGTTERVLLSI